MLRLLLDANMSPRTADYLRSHFKFDVEALSGTPLRSLPDVEVIAHAKATRRILITLDEDFGEIYYRNEHGGIGIVFIRLPDQSTNSVNQRLDLFFRNEATRIDLDRSLVVLTKRKCRVMTAG